MRSPALPIVITFALLVGCKTSPTTSPEPGQPEPTMPGDEAGGDPNAPGPSSELFEDEPVSEDDRDVDDAG